MRRRYSEHREVSDPEHSAGNIQQRVWGGLDPSGFNELAQCRFGPMLYNKNDRFLGESLQKYGEFSFFEYDLFRQLIGAGDVVVEVGANIGAHTVQLSRLAATVHAFEPQRIVFQMLCANLALNQCANVFAMQEGVSDQCGTLMAPALPPTERCSFGSAGLAKNNWDGESVYVVTLDSLMLACHFLKIDVEGMEAEVLRGGEDTIVRCQPLIYVENDREDKSRELIETVERLGYTAYWHFPPLFNPDNFAGDPENIFPGIVSVNMLCVPPGREVNGLVPVASPAEKWQAGVARETERNAK